jgi:phage terminase small subunit
VRVADRKRGQKKPAGPSPRERLFAHLYVAGDKERKGRHNATAAARGAGYREGPGLATTASRLLKKAEVAAYIAELEAKALAKVDSKRDQVLAELHHLGLARITRVQNDDGSLKPKSEWPEAELAALTSLEVREKLGKPVMTDDGVAVVPVVSRSVKARMDSKLGALNTLAEHHGLVKRKDEGAITFRLEDLIVAARNRLELQKREREGGGAA